MEKINDYSLASKMMSQNKNIRLIFLTNVLVISLSLLPQNAIAQIRAGSGYLKMLPAAREVGQAGTLTGALDHTHSFYANPAATGFLREWQWSASYTNWISDIYNASLLYSKNIRTPWSRWSRFALGVNYLGIPEFNNAGERDLPVSGTNLLVTGSVGQPLHFLSRLVAVGANIKYFNSNLAGYKQHKLIFDVGLLGRSRRLSFLAPKNGLLDYAIVSAGVSVTNLGSPLTFVAEESPLPRTLRVGVAVNVGAHHGLQLGIGSDYRAVRDENGFLTFTSEISWRQIISLQIGYSTEDNLLGNFTFGGSLRLDDWLFKKSLWGQNNTLRFDLAANQNNDFFAAPYHGTATHQPLGPEYFRLISPPYNQNIDQQQVTLTWEPTQDPDLYDDVFYHLLVDQDSVRLAKLVAAVYENREALPTILNENNLRVSCAVNQDSYELKDLSFGDYFWTVLAYDHDQHGRFGVMQQRPLAKFHVTASDPRVIAIDFDYHPWITQDDFQGKLRVQVQNLGDRTAQNFTLEIYDSLTTGGETEQLLYQKPLAVLQPGQAETIELDWNTSLAGRHRIYTKIRTTNEDRRVVNLFENSFYTIPKGTFTTGDTVVVQKQAQIIYDLPYVGKIFFDVNSSVVAPQYLSDWTIQPPLALYAKRLKENPTIKITLQGTIDPNSGETDPGLADQRANAVRDELYNLGVGYEQMMVLPGLMLPRRRVPRNPEDARWVFEERRRVDITTVARDEKVLFKPLKTTYIKRQNEPAIFKANIFGVVPVKAGLMKLNTNELEDSASLLPVVSGAQLMGDYPLHLEQLQSPPAWLDQDVTYSITLTDTLNREFKTRPKLTKMQAKIVGREWRYYVLAKFESTMPFYEFYWTGLLDLVPFLTEEKNTRIRFEGHGCATGPEAVNDRLSKQRARDFQNKFLQGVQTRYPQLYRNVKSRLDAPRGAGEAEPFEIRTENGQPLLIGDNQQPLGRQLNRRVMIKIYSGD